MTDKEKLLASIERGYRIVESRGLKLVRADDLARTRGIVHGFSTRMGGVSPAPFDSLNFSTSRDDKNENVLRNYRVFCDAFDIDPASLVVVNHEHGNNIVRVTRDDRGRGIYNGQLPFCDGMITDDPEVTLVTLHADCCCVYLFDPVARAIGLAHAGWKGTFKRVGQRLAEKLISEFRSDPKNLVAAIGPGISFDLFEVETEIADDFAREFDHEGIKKPGKPGKAYVDITAALMIQLLDAGVQPQNICAMDICTFTRDDLFYSYRRDRTKTGAMIGYLALKNE